jgi:predicted Zn-dependent protease
MLSPSASPQLVEDTLSLWARFAPHGKVLPGAAKLAGAATADRRVSFADYFNRVGDPGAARALLGSSQQPVTRVNARWNAVFAQSLALQGQLREAKSLFDLVLDREPDQSEALRGRSSLEAQNGMTKQAIIDAQRLVTISPGTGEDRLLLAQAYLADGNRNEVRRTLWEAFQELPNDERVYSALKNVLASTGDTDAQRRLDEEAADRRTSKLTKELI